MKIEQIKQHLEQIAEQCGGRLEPETVVRAAQSEDHPLHDFFTWSDDEAAEKWRHYEATALIRRCRVKIRSEDGKESGQVRAFVNVRDFRVTPESEESEDSEDIPEKPAASGNSKKGFYLGVEEALANDFYRSQLLSQALRDLKAFNTKYRELSELARVIEENERVIETTEATKLSAVL